MWTALSLSRRQCTNDELITSPDNEKLKRIRKLRSRRERERTGLFVVEGEDLVAAAEAAGAEPELVLVAGEDVEPRLLSAVSTLGSGTRVIGVYRQRLVAGRAGELSVYLHGVADPGNVGTILRAAHALCDGPVVLGPGCADPYSPKAVRASMGSVFARPPARAELAGLTGTKLALDGGGGDPAGRAGGPAAGRDLPRGRARGPAGGAVGRRPTPAPGSRCGPTAPTRSMWRWPPPWRCTSWAIGWPLMPDVQGRIAELRRDAEAAIGAALGRRRAGGAAGSLPGPQGRADRDPAGDRRAAGRGAGRPSARPETRPGRRWRSCSQAGGRSSRRPSSRTAWPPTRST